MSLRRTLFVAAAAVVASATALVMPAAAQAAAAPTLAGAWAPLNRCPVDAPAMLAADGVTVAAACLSSSAPSGTIKIGSTTLTTGATDLQLGLLNQGGVYTVVAPAAGTVVGDPVDIPGGLLGLMCPSAIPFVTAICQQLANNPLNRVTATIQSAGAPTDFNLANGVGVGQPILTLPVKIKLDNPFLGSTCYIGSNSNPIVLKPANLTKPTGRVVRFNADGTPSATGEQGYLSVSGAAQGDSTFAVPRSNGCGLLGILSGAVDLKQGLPSAAGANNLVLNDAVTNLGGFQTPRNFAPTEGQQLSNRWHAAVI
ncbi:hypothetical protein [Actinophytocola oryzae]|uniref:Secreted protein n=1 Tax=Actinophytocola oryzae TaxID=502181 RepID=A0A4R7V0Q9_9PSEU|nr:hypothetical protein [Actinophytocola oryzae]TDV41395.1 hypothetical protein CLV71_12085 [Actinophytocola oryzae]